MKAKFPGICARTGQQFSAGTLIRRNPAGKWETAPARKSIERVPEPVPSREVLEQITFRRGDFGEPHQLSTTIYANLMEITAQFYKKTARPYLLAGITGQQWSNEEIAFREREIDYFLAEWREPSHLSFVTGSNTAHISYPHAHECGVFCRENVNQKLRGEIEQTLAELIAPTGPLVYPNSFWRICIDVWRGGIRTDDKSGRNGRQTYDVGAFRVALAPDAIWPAMGVAVSFLRHEQMWSNFRDTQLEDALDKLANPLDLPETLI